MNTIRMLTLDPLDTLFFRDARPMESGTGSGGHGANWPLPTVIYKALRTGLLMDERALPSCKSIPHLKRDINGNIRKKQVGSDLFRSLRMMGPFPFSSNTAYFPMPADVVMDEKKQLHRLMPAALDKDCESNLPYKWLRPVCSPVPPSRQELPNWVSVDWFRNYLTGGTLVVPESVQPFCAEYRTGIKVNDESGTAEDKYLFSSEHLRLKDGFAMLVFASLNYSDTKGCPEKEAIEKLIGQCIGVGGEGRLCRIHAGNGNPLSILEPPAVKGKGVKWTLATPACFNKGWLPNWIDDTGKVRLKQGDMARKSGESRLDWRNRIRRMPDVGAKLVAARISKAIPVSGWDMLEAENSLNGGPRATQLLVPAGSAYYFEADPPQDAGALVAALHGRTLSDKFGEAGMGLGYCSQW